MNRQSIPRREFMARMAGSLVATLISPRVFASDTTLHFSAWGTANRERLTSEAFSLFEAAYPGTDIDCVFTDWLDYWRSLSTLTALGNTPDLMQMDYRYLAEYAHSNVLEELDPYLDNLLNIKSFGTQNIDSCKVDGRLYGVNLGINAAAGIFDKMRWEEAGVEAPETGDSWDIFKDKCIRFANGSPHKNYYPVMDCSGLETLFETWMLQRGKAMYQTDGSLGFHVADAIEWYDYWAELRARKACVPPDIQILYKNSIETSPLILGYAAMDYAHSNMMENYQKLSDRKLGITACPVLPGGKPGQYYKPSQMLSIARGLKPVKRRRAIQLANFLVMDPGAVTVLGVDRGIPASSEMRAMLAPKLSETGQASLAYIDKLAPHIGPLPPIPPFGAGEIAIVLQRIAHEISYGLLSPAQGGRQLYAEASGILAR
jgi:multiple sugar transport system substrate-binding protein